MAIDASTLVVSAAAALKERAEEVNRLNVFPVPDGDTGTNMSLTMDAVVRELSGLSAAPTVSDVCHAVTHGSLMGARGNSGVILSQILRGLCEVAGGEEPTTETLAAALERSVTVAFQAVRKPVEGTMLTVLRDSAEEARRCADLAEEPLPALKRVVAAAFESVRNTPELLPVLKENGVVDAGGFGLAILFEGFVAAATGEAVVIADVSSAAAPLLRVEPVDDWDDSEYLYCTEFLLFGSDLDRESVHDFVSDAGGSELVVGDPSALKIHVHTNDPGSVLAHMTGLGEIAEVHVHNMRRQQAERDERLVSEEASHGGASAAQPSGPAKPLGFVAVAAGDGMREILQSLGVDVVVSGGQTMNPSTADLLEAIRTVNAKSVIVLPNNKNIVMAANAAADVAEKKVVVVPTRSVPASFSAMLAWDGESGDADAVGEAMLEAASAVTTGEVTTAVKDASAKSGKIAAGDVIGIVDDEAIEVIGNDVSDVANRLADVLLSGGAETLMLLSGQDVDPQQVDEVVATIQERYPDVAVESHVGGQPLYPFVMSAE